MLLIPSSFKQMGEDTSVASSTPSRGGGRQGRMNVNVAACVRSSIGMKILFE